MELSMRFRSVWRTAPLTIPSLLTPSASDAAKLSIVPRMRPVSAVDFAFAKKQITGGPWTMEQAWRATPENELRSGTVRFGWTPDALWVVAELTDKHIASSSTTHNQDMWALGDVFEIFVARRGSPRYLELHVTPNNHRLHLRWTERDFAQVRKKQKSVADFHAEPDAFQSWVRRYPEGSGWQVLARIPATIFPGGLAFRAGQRFAFSFSRYDAGPEETPKILSSTSPHRKLNYHRRHEWRTVLLGP